MQVRARKTNWIFTFSLLLASQQFFASGCFSTAHADTISPNITSGGKVYSEERPNKEFFGSGMSGRLSEASYLRFSGEQALDDGDLDVALKKLSKAVQLDSGDPGGHLLYARAMTGKINRTLRKHEDVDQELLMDCIDEWKLIWRHDADTSEQAEAKAQARRLVQIAKLLNLQQQGLLQSKDEAKLAGTNHKRLAGKKVPKLADRDGFNDSDKIVDGDGLPDRKSDDAELKNMVRSQRRQLAERERPDREDQ